MKEFLGLRTLIYKATDLDAAKKWYTDALGFPPYFDTPFYVGYMSAATNLVFIRQTKSLSKVRT